jgi:hypothetical protein
MIVSATRALGTTGFDTTTLVIAVVGLALAAISLAWQAATFTLAGSRIRVEILRGVIGSGVLITYPLSGGHRTASQCTHPRECRPR